MAYSKIPSSTPSLFDLNAVGEFITNTEKPTGLLLDLFCGHGGTSIGAETALKRTIDVAINHSPTAISVHRRNHPHTRHYLSDIFEVDPIEATKGQPVDVLFASPDCTSFSSAKGSAPVRKHLRALPWVTLRWAAKTRPRFMVIENVPEMMNRWGKLIPKRKNGEIVKDKHGNPVITNSAHPKHRNRHWKRFLKQLSALGYHVEYKVLCAADYGAPTTRKRLFIIASRDHESIPWPVQTHAPKTDPRVTSGELKAWIGVGSVLDFNTLGTSIFDEKSRTSAHNTMRRIAIGIERHVLLSNDPFIIPKELGNATPAILVNNHQNVPYSVKRPSPTITTQHNRLQLVSAHGIPTSNASFISKYGSGNLEKNSNRYHISCHQPADTITTINHHSPAQIQPQSSVHIPALNTYYGGEKGSDRTSDLDRPMPTQTTENRHSVVTTQLQEINAACIAHQFATSNANSAQQPLESIVVSNAKNYLLESKSKAAEQRLTTEQRSKAEQIYHLLMEFVPDTAQKYVIPGTQTIGRQLHGQTYVLTDITLRMLMPKELKLAQGFPQNYVIEEDLHGKPLSKSQQIHGIGNSVPPPFSHAIGLELKKRLETPPPLRPMPVWLQKRRKHNISAQAAD